MNVPSTGTMAMGMAWHGLTGHTQVTKVSPFIHSPCSKETRRVGNCPHPPPSSTEYVLTEYGLNPGTKWTGGG
ncbi:hypothetical protein IF1G_00480 [Cordyceps javanica]|uniref:Uncharacterized protein n=1 Tax=Cordyceps javanica TaxID=43265 RepID=A0A545VFP5_9HYPO|nr:hypothetical protein IF1G_00480 [Cordyceps javanica]